MRGVQSGEAVSESCGKQLNMGLAIASVIDGAATGKRDDIIGTARCCDTRTKFTILDLSRLTRAYSCFDTTCGKLSGDIDRHWLAWRHM